ncbi:hypothetical protein TSMEX_002338 [Taenia solium]|eukprot:TsM_000066700 transcript=TsM_000066700 gene=TsM_000066700
MESTPSMTTGSLPTTLDEFTTTTTVKTDFSHLVPMVDLSDMSIRLLNRKDYRLVPGARLENGRLLYENGTSISVRDVPGFYPPEDAISNAIVSVNLLRGTTTLLNLETSEPIMSRRSSDGIPLETIRNYGAGTSFEILLDNAIIQVDSYQGEWTVQNAETGDINLVQEVKNGVLYLANGEHVKMPTTESEDEVLAIEAVTGVVRTVNKATGECFASLQPDIFVTIPVEEEQVPGTEGMETELTSSLPLREEGAPSTEVSISPSVEEEGSSTVTPSPPLEEEKRLWTLPSLSPLEKEEVSFTITLSTLSEEEEGSSTVTSSSPLEEEEGLSVATLPFPSSKKVEGSPTVTSSSPLEEEDGLSTVALPSLEEEGGSSTVTSPPFLEEKKTSDSVLTIISSPPSTDEALSTVEKEIEDVKYPSEQPSSVDEVTSSSFPTKEEGVKENQKTTQNPEESWITGNGSEEAKLSLEDKRSTPSSEAEETTDTLSPSKEEEIPTTEASKIEDMEIKSEITTPSKDDKVSYNTEICSDEGSPILVVTGPPPSTEENEGEDTVAQVGEERGDFGIATDFVNKEALATMTTVEEKSDKLEDKVNEVVEGEETTLDLHLPEKYTTTTLSPDEYYKLPDPLYQEEDKTMSSKEEIKAPELEDIFEERTSTILPEEREPHHEALIEIPPFQGPKEGEIVKVSTERGTHFSDSGSQSQEEQANMISSDEIDGETTYTTSNLEKSTESLAVAEDPKPEELVTTRNHPRFGVLLQSRRC